MSSLKPGQIVELQGDMRLFAPMLYEHLARYSIAPDAHSMKRFTHWLRYRGWFGEDEHYPDRSWVLIEWKNYCDSLTYLSTQEGLREQTNPGRRL